MICNECGFSDCWIGEDMLPVKGHPNIEEKVKICSCGNTQGVEE